MKRYLVLLGLSLLLSNCDRRQCECQEDMNFFWKDDRIDENVVVSLPNSVLNMGHSLAILVRSANGITASVEWELLSADFSKGDLHFLEGQNLTDFILDDNTLRFPHELFVSEDGALFTGALEIKMTLFFPQSEATLALEGSIYYYDCDDFNGSFGPADCRWPNQALGNDYFANPC